jgi:hypothetical protein
VQVSHGLPVQVSHSLPVQVSYSLVERSWRSTWVIASSIALLGFGMDFAGRGDQRLCDLVAIPNAAVCLLSSVLLDGLLANPFPAWGWADQRPRYRCRRGQGNVEVWHGDTWGGSGEVPEDYETCTSTR